MTPAERQATLVLALALTFGSLAGLGGWDAALVRYAEARLHPRAPTVSALAAALGPGDPRVAWYAAGLALRAERARAGAAPEPVDPNTADRAAWDRLPGIGPRTAEAILAHRAAHGPFESAEALLDVRGIGPRTLERLRPFLRQTAAAEGGAGLREAPLRPRLNTVSAGFLEGLPKVGPKLATEIIRVRQRRRGFQTWADVDAIKGIGPATLKLLQNTTRLEDVRPQATVAERGHEGTAE